LHILYTTYSFLIGRVKDFHLLYHLWSWHTKHLFMLYEKVDEVTNSVIDLKTHLLKQKISHNDTSLQNMVLLSQLQIKLSNLEKR
jgi:hypothetical protein